MRVTNEQAKADIFCHNYHSCSECKLDNICNENALEASTSDYAADLLEARELIKEMRALLIDDLIWAVPAIASRAEGLLEKSKEYAE